MFCIDGALILERYCYRMKAAYVVCFELFPI